MKKMSIKTVVAIGIGAALFFVLGRFVAIPVPFVPNTTFNLQYGVLGLFAAMFGPVAGLLIGFVGHTLIDLSWGSPWWSWILASACFGLLTGLFASKLDLESGVFGKKEILTFNIAQVVAHAISWIVVAPGLDILVYAESVEKVFAQGAVAGILNAITTGIVGTVLMLAYSKTRTKKGSLNKE